MTVLRYINPLKVVYMLPSLFNRIFARKALALTAGVFVVIIYVVSCKQSDKGEAYD